MVQIFKLTITQKLFMYKQALKLVHNNETTDIIEALKICITKFRGRSSLYIPINSKRGLKFNFEDLAQFKPMDKEYGELWWKGEYAKDRTIEVLTILINNLKPKVSVIRIAKSLAKKEAKAKIQYSGQVEMLKEKYMLYV